MSDPSETTHDMLTFAGSLESSGLTREQAVTIARGSARMVEQHSDALATKSDIHLLATRMDSLAKRDEVRALSVNMEYRFSHIEHRLRILETLPVQMRVQTWMLGFIVAALLVPQLQAWFN